jgi:hypothetical protein
VLTIRGETKNIMEWFKVSPVHNGTFYRRIRQGWSVEKAMMTPNTWHKNAYKKTLTNIASVGEEG